MLDRDKIAIVISGGRISLKSINEPGEDYVPLSDSEFLNFLPEDLREKIYLVDWSRQPAGHYSLRMVSDLVQLAARQAADGAGGVVLACGAHGLEEMAYFADLVWSFAQPLVFVSSTQYHSAQERAKLLRQAVFAAGSSQCWGRRVLVLCDGELLSASDIVQVSNYRRGGFKTPNCGPIAEFEGSRIFTFCSRQRLRILPVDIQPARRVEVLYSTIGGGETMLSAFQGKTVKEIDGLVIAGLGDGEISPSWIPYIKKFLREEIPVVLTSRCANGRVMRGFNFEGSSYRLLEMGVIDGGGLNPVQARIKLALGTGAGLHGEDLQNYILEDNF